VELKVRSSFYKHRSGATINNNLQAETVKGSSLAFQGIDDIHGGDCLSLGVLSVSDGVPNDILKEDFEDSSGLFVDQSGDSLHSTTTSQTTNGWFGDTLDVVAKDFSMAFGTSYRKMKKSEKEIPTINQSIYRVSE
jgi:hypothetical protein